ncbi:MAG TPA: hypothetical protein VJP77_01940, partial [Planctomycetota bacterium]|nr:hypothetical protein [Planctomycetota bacterium]
VAALDRPSDPARAAERFAEWERLLGLPERYLLGMLSPAQRVATIADQLRALGRPPASITELARALGGAGRSA